MNEHIALEHAIVDAINAEMGVQRISPAELARRMERPYDSTRNYLILERRLPLEVLLDIAETLGVNPDELVAKARTEYLEKRLKRDS